MICNVCGTKEATIHLTEIVNGQMAEIHICERCAEEKGTDFKTYFNLGDLLTGLRMEIAKSGGKKMPPIVCCGLTLRISQTGRQVLPTVIVFLKSRWRLSLNRCKGQAITWGKNPPRYRRKSEALMTFVN